MDFLQVFREQCQWHRRHKSPGTSEERNNSVVQYDSPRQLTTFRVYHVFQLPFLRWVKRGQVRKEWKDDCHLDLTDEKRLNDVKHVGRVFEK